MTAAGDCRRDGPFSGEGFLQGASMWLLKRGLPLAGRLAVSLGDRWQDIMN